MSAGLPKNNLDQFLNKPKTGISASTSSVPAAAAKSTRGSKFKPAGSASKPATAAPRGLVKNLNGSFSTPGFAHSASASARSRAPAAVVDISSDDNGPNTPTKSAAGVKRESPLNFDESPSSPKRLKQADNKENIRLLDLKGKDREEAPLTGHINNPFDDLDRDYPMKEEEDTQMDLEDLEDFSVSRRASPVRRPPPPVQRPPATRHPQSASSIRPVAGTSSDPEHPDLPLLSEEKLNSLIASNYELDEFYSSALAEGTGDMILLEAIGTLIRGRMAAVSAERKARKKGKLAISTVTRVVPQSAPPFKAESYEQPRQGGSISSRFPTPQIEPTARLQQSVSRQSTPAPQRASSSTYASTSYAESTTIRDGTSVSTHNSTYTRTAVVEKSFQNSKEANPASDNELWDEVEEYPEDFYDDSMIASGPSARVEAPLKSSRVVAREVSPDLEIFPSSNLTETPFYAEIMSSLRNYFGLNSFRKNQLEAINGTMSGRDVFVLMPTGGGKSLCYQLPSVCVQGKTCGVSVVVSPLIALMDDQVNALKAKGVDVLLWNGDASAADSSAIARRLHGSGKKPALLYVTPEKLHESNSLRNILAKLYERNELARFVIDEAHCISSWGRDFRDAYTKLDFLRDQYPSVPIIALTATANKSCVKDIISRLRMHNPLELQQSFNRKNLYYEIRTGFGGKSLLDNIAEFIRTKYAGACGIIYCFSKRNCEDVAKKLRDDYNISAKHYHAGMDKTEKTTTQREWQTGAVDVIVATIAFGMGIDKADVRFVIHHSLPKSVEGYYQETGRAGRDGNPADCILYYNYYDAMKLINMINKPPEYGQKVLPQAELLRQEEGVRQVANFCANISDCRRVQIMTYFDERFDPNKCHDGCDNCASTETLNRDDVTAEALIVVQFVESQGASMTQKHCGDVLYGANNAAVREKGHDQHEMHGRLRHKTRDIVARIIDKLLMDQALALSTAENKSGWNTTYIEVGKFADNYLYDTPKVEIMYRLSSVKAGKKDGPSRKPSTKASGSGSVAISMVVKRKRAQTTVFHDVEDPIALYQEDEPVPVVDEDFIEIESPRKKKSGKVVLKVPDPPSTGKVMEELIAVCQKFADDEGLSSYHDVLDDELLSMLYLRQVSNSVEFQAILENEYMQRDNSDEGMGKASNLALSKWSSYGKEIVKVCKKHNHVEAASGSAAVVTKTFSEYAFTGSPTKTASTKKQFKFIGQR